MLPTVHVFLVFLAWFGRTSILSFGKIFKAHRYPILFPAPISFPFGRRALLEPAIEVLETWHFILRCWLTATLNLASYEMTIDINACPEQVKSSCLLLKPAGFWSLLGST